jgi:CheY-like chemotaxis protein
MALDRAVGVAVLIVEADPGERERFGSWLERSGFEVVFCPGPTEPDYTCVGAREGICPLVAEVDAVVLDMSLESEAVMVGTSAEEILGFYLMSGRRVVALGSRSGDDVPGQLVRLRRHPSPDELVEALGAFFDGS